MNRAAREKTGFRPGHATPWPALVAGVLWLAAGLSGGYWALKALGRSPVTEVAAPATQGVSSDVTSVARALGGLPPAQAASSAPAPVVRYSLLGVADQPGLQGSALIALDGQLPRPYRVGALIEGGLVLQSVDRRTARLGVSMDGPTTVELSLPPAVEN